MNHDHPIRGAVFDIDGTLAMMDKSSGVYTPLPGAIEAVEACRAQGLPVVAYTNGTFFHPDDYYPRLAASGLRFDPGHVLTPASVAAHHLVEAGVSRVMVFAEEGTSGPLRDAGIEVVAPDAYAGAVDAVLCGWTRTMTVPMLEAVCDAVWKGAKAYTTSSAPFYAGAKGRMLGISGALAAMLESVTGTTVELFGKPSGLGLDMIAALTGVAAENLLVVGDDPALELRMARKAGAFAIGVTTGLCDRNGFEAYAPEVRAHVVLDTLERFSAHQWFPNKEDVV